MPVFFSDRLAKMGFTFKKFHITQHRTAMKVGTDGVLLGAWAEGGAHILDIGTGTGLIALMMAQRFPSAHIDAIEMDEGALADARLNIMRSPFKDRISVIGVTLQRYRAQADRPYDAIVCNPPYFINSLKNPLQQRAAARHTDTLSYGELARHAAGLLKEGGTFSVIIPAENKGILEPEALFNGLSMQKTVRIRTKGSKPVKRCLLEFTKGMPDHCTVSEETLSRPDGTRTEWYKQLTDAFYIR